MLQGEMLRHEKVVYGRILLGNSLYFSSKDFQNLRKISAPSFSIDERFSKNVPVFVFFSIPIINEENRHPLDDLEENVIFFRIF